MFRSCPASLQRYGDKSRQIPSANLADYCIGSLEDKNMTRRMTTEQNK